MLTGEYLTSLPIGSVISVLMTASSGTGHRIPIAFAKRGDDVWDVHARSWVNSKRLIGGRATARKRRSPREPAPVPETTQRRVSFAEAAARMTKRNDE
ncbi:hypothetical protein [Modestobacter marinus]|uniref:Uncharacterized protein n=1 Tax=Modestobacter marinus TaxID=477641 RepID=A0A846LMK2_9ACTN|nr:hypothetical protein [Modestobacter marinus]NIH67362.1 hypothetical protein [Modestobacter marinus]